MARPVSIVTTPTGMPTNNFGTPKRLLSKAPGSKSVSRSNSTKRTSRISIFSASSMNASTESLKRKSTLNGVTGSSKPSDIKRWDGNRRTTTNWDFVRRDPELWFPSGDCLVHFYGRGQSRRGASLRLMLGEIESSNCRPLLERCCASPVPESPGSTSGSTGSSEDGGYFTNPSSAGKYELYIPAPAHLNREEALQYHLTTRNFFAWMFEKPMVGHKLGVSLVSLLDRMNEFRPDQEENQDDLFAYIDNLGYSDFRDCPDHALAIIHFAEHFEYRDLWTDAFVHCAGMNDDLITSGEFMSVSKTTKALITRAHLEMSIRLERAGKSLCNFLEDDLAASHLGLPAEAQRHLERFRSFLHSFYVQKTGYWPPPSTNKKGNAFSNSTFRSMYFDFRNLYEYLVDTTFTSSMALNRPTAGGVYGLQAITAFDKRNRYATLPYPLALVPEVSHLSPAQKSGALSRFFGNKQAQNDRRMAHLCALSAATNCEDVKVMESGLVREYFKFEREWTLREEEKVSVEDARKVRWILVYTVLQTLASVTRAPSEVRDTEGVDYPLCCQIAGTPPWGTRKASTPMAKDSAGITTIPHRATKATNIIDIHPALRPIPTDSDLTRPSTPPRRLLTRIHSSPNLRDSVLKASAKPVRSAPAIAPLIVRHPQPRKPFCEILINGYGNGNGDGVATPCLPPTHPSSPIDVQPTATVTPPTVGTADSDPETPSSAESAGHSSGWSARRDSESECSSLPSIYGDNGSSYSINKCHETRTAALTDADDEWTRMGVALGRALDSKREEIGGGYFGIGLSSPGIGAGGQGLGVMDGGIGGSEVNGIVGSGARKRRGSVDSWAPGRINPEVERYVGF